MLDPVSQPHTRICMKRGLCHSSVDAVISFPSGLTISWEGQPIGNVNMNNLSIVADVGGTIDTETTFEVLNVDHLTDFTKVRLSLNAYR